MLIIAVNLVSSNLYFKNSVVSNMSSDIQLIESALGSNFSIYVRCGVSVIFCLAIMCYISLKLTGVTLVAVILITIISRIFMTVTKNL